MHGGRVPDDLTLTHQSPGPGLSAGGEGADDGKQLPKGLHNVMSGGERKRENQAEGGRWDAVTEVPQQVTCGHSPHDVRELRKGLGDRLKEAVWWRAVRVSSTQPPGSYIFFFGGGKPLPY